ncbi:MAG: hypothetical protein KBC84_04665 [Proteobacteria bacterium]|nr:hypothetical protein [Pseudomonadota bacterium]
MSHSIFLKLVFLGVSIFSLNSAFAQAPVPSSDVKKYELDDNHSLTIKQLKRTNQGALMFKYDVEIVQGKGREWIACSEVSLTDLATKTVYHSMIGAGTSSGNQYFHNGSKVSCWVMMTEPPASLKTVNLNVSNFAPIVIELP